MSDQPTESKPSVSALLVPWADAALLLPNASVLEVLRQPEVSLQAGSDEGAVSGQFRWRNRMLPLFDLTRLCDRKDNSKAGKRRVLVCQGYSQKPSQQYIGIEASGIPRMIVLDEDAFKALEGNMLGDVPLVAVIELQGQPAYIPDLEQLAQMVA